MIPIEHIELDHSLMHHMWVQELIRGIFSLHHILMQKLINNLDGLGVLYVPSEHERNLIGRQNCGLFHIGHKNLASTPVK